MNRVSLKAISGLVLTVFLILIATQIAASGQDAKGRRIEGTWRVQVTPTNCQGGAGPISFPGKNTFLSGGSMIATGSTTAPFLLSTGHGVWEHTGGRTFVNTLEFFAYTQDHTYVGIQKVTRNIELSGDFDEFTSHDSFELIAPNGAVIGTGCSTVTGRRME